MGQITCQKKQKKYIYQTTKKLNVIIEPKTLAQSLSQSPYSKKVTFESPENSPQGKILTNAGSDEDSEINSIYSQIFQETFLYLLKSQEFPLSPHLEKLFQDKEQSKQLKVAKKIYNNILRIYSKLKRHDSIDPEENQKKVILTAFFEIVHDYFKKMLHASRQHKFSQNLCFFLIENLIYLKLTIKDYNNLSLWKKQQLRKRRTYRKTNAKTTSQNKEFLINMFIQMAGKIRFELEQMKLEKKVNIQFAISRPFEFSSSKLSEYYLTCKKVENEKFHYHHHRQSINLFQINEINNF